MAVPYGTSDNKSIKWYNYCSNYIFAVIIFIDIIRYDLLKVIYIECKSKVIYRFIVIKYIILCLH